MSFLNSSFLWFLPLLVAPLLIHLINNRKPKRVLFSYIQVIRQADHSLMPRKRLKDLLLILVRTLLILFLVLFFSRPVLQSGNFFNQENQSSTLIILLDNSASMGLIKGGQSALQVAKTQIKNLLRRIDADIKIGFVAYSDDVEEEVAPTSERARITTAIDAVKLRPRPTDVRPALELTAQMLDRFQSDTRSLLIVSDQARNGWESLDQADGGYEGYDPEVRILLWELGEPDSNVGISQGELQLSEKGTLKGHWKKSQSGSLAKNRNWKLQLNNRIVGQGVIDNNRAKGDSISMQAQLPEGGYYSGRVALDHDSLPMDDVFYLAGRIPKGFRLLIVDGESGLAPSDSEIYYLKLALESPRDPRLESIHVIRPEVFNQESLDKYDAIVLANVGQVNDSKKHLIQWVEKGGGLLLTAGSNWPKGSETPLGLFRSKGNVNADRRVREPDPSSAFVKHLSEIKSFQWGQIRVGQYRRLEKESALEVILSLDNGDPLLVKKKFGKGFATCLTTTLDRNWTNLPAKPIFSPLIREVIASLSDPLREQTDLVGQVGEPFRVRLPSGIKRATVIMPNGTSGGATVTPDGFLEWPSPEDPGLYQVKTDRQANDFSFAINVKDLESEGKLNRVPPDILKSIFPKAAVNWLKPGTNTVASILAALQGKDMTKILMALLFVLLFFELILSFPRKSHG